MPPQGQHSRSDTIEGCTNGDATERRNDPPSLLRAMEDKLRKSSGWNRLRRGYGGSSALLEYAVMHEDEAEAARLRAELAKLVEKV